MKARCGGYKIENTWSEQDTLTELKRLVHSINSLPNEILYYKCEYPNKLNYSTGQCEVEVAKFGWDATFGTKEVHERYGYNQINWNPGIHSQDYSSGKHTITFNIMGFVPKGAVITSATWHIRYHIYPRYSQDVASGNLAINENVVTGGGFATFSHYGLWKFAGIIRVSWYYP